MMHIYNIWGRQLPRNRGTSAEQTDGGVSSLDRPGRQLQDRRECHQSRQMETSAA